MDSPILTESEALILTRKRTRRALQAWLRIWAPAAHIGRGRYSRDRVMRGLNAEAASSSLTRRARKARA